MPGAFTGAFTGASQRFPSPDEGEILRCPARLIGESYGEFPGASSASSPGITLMNFPLSKTVELDITKPCQSCQQEK